MPTGNCREAESEVHWPAVGFPRFSGQRRRPQAGYIDQRDVVQPHIWG